MVHDGHIYSNDASSAYRLRYQFVPNHEERNFCKVSCKSEPQRVQNLAVNFATVLAEVLASTGKSQGILHIEE